LVDGKTDFSTAEFDSYYIRFHNLTPEITGEIRLTFSGPTRIQYYNAGDFLNPITDPEYYSGVTPFDIYPDPEYDDGRYVIWGNRWLMDGRFTSENAFSGNASNSFEVAMSDSTTFSNNIPPFLKISELLSSTSTGPEAIAPYVELITSGDLLAGAKVTFVKGGDPNQVVNVSDNAYLNYGMEVDYAGRDSTGYIGGEVSGIQGLQSGDFYFDTLTDLKNVWGVGIRVRTSSYRDTVHTEYEWRNLLNWPKGAEILVPDQDAVDAANAAVTSLDIPVTVTAMRGTGVTQNTALIIDGEGKPIASPIPQRNFAEISSAIAVSEDVTPGGAILVGEINLPFNETSLTVSELPSFSEEDYTVLKYFADGSYIDLKELGMVDFDTSSKEAKLNAPLVIVDGTPGNEPGVTFPDGNTNKNYGIKVVGNGTNKYLFVYDGDENGNANDPITLSNVQSPPPSSPSGGGCDAGFGIFAVFALAGLGLFKSRCR
jgi:hypothetical protein